MKCPNCGSENRAGASWCSLCFYRFNQNPLPPRPVPTVTSKGPTQRTVILGGVVGGICGVLPGFGAGMGAFSLLERLYFEGKDPMTTLGISVMAFFLLSVGGAILGCLLGAVAGRRIARGM